MTNPPSADHDASLPIYTRIVELLQRGELIRESKVHPETRKVLERAADRLTALEDASSHRASDVAKGLAKIKQAHGWLTQEEPQRVSWLSFRRRDKPSEEQTWLLADSLQRLWIRTATDEVLKEEAARTPAASTSAAPSGDDADRLRARLLRNHSDVQVAAINERARVALRAKYLRGAGLILVGLVVASWAVGVALLTDEGVLSLCALAGATGGALSGARSLRDSDKTKEANVFQTWWWVQPIVGAAVGLLIYALLVSPVLALPGSDATDPAEHAAALVVYAFLAGFSEPWLLGIVGRIGGTAEKAASAESTKRDTLGTDGLDPADQPANARPGQQPPRHNSG